MNINYIEISNNGKIKINYDKGQDKLHVESGERATPEFYKSFAELKDVLLEIIQKNSLANSIGVRSIKFTENDTGSRYCLIRGYFVNKNQSGVDTVKIETPDKLIEDKKATAKRDLGLSKKSQDIISKLVEEACLFVKGHRAQQNLFDRETINKIENVIEKDEEQHTDEEQQQMIESTSQTDKEVK